MGQIGHRWTARLAWACVAGELAWIAYAGIQLLAMLSAARVP